MKKLLFIATVLFSSLFTSCSKDYSDENLNQEKTISLNMEGDFIFESFTRSTVSTTTEVEDLWVFDYVDGTCVQTIHKGKGDSDFWNPSITLKYGKHNLYFLVSGGQNPNHMASINIISWETVGDTFWNKLDIDVNNFTAGTLDVWVNRVATMLKVKSSDDIPDDAKELEIIPTEWDHGINYTTGEPGALYVEKRKVFKLPHDGSKAEIMIYGISSSTEKKTDILFYSRINASTIIKGFTVKNVPFKANRITTMTGNMFNGTTTNATDNTSTDTNDSGHKTNIQVNTTWLNGVDVSW